MSSDCMLYPLVVNWNTIEEMNSLYSNYHIPSQDMEGGSSRVPPLKKCNQKRVIPMDATHEGPHPKTHSSNESMISTMRNCCPSYRMDG